MERKFGGLCYWLQRGIAAPDYSSCCCCSSSSCSSCWGDLFKKAYCLQFKIGSGKRTVNTLWFNNECKAAVRSRRKALKRATVSPSSENIENYRIIRAKSRRTIRSSRRQSWQTFVSKINSRTSLKKVWNLVSKISGKKSPTAVHHLNVNNNEITSGLDIANTFGHTFSSNSSTEHYTDAFNAHCKKVEKQPLKFKSNNNETYNCLLSPRANSSNRKII